MKTWKSSRDSSSDEAKCLMLKTSYMPSGKHLRSIHAYLPHQQGDLRLCFEIPRAGGRIFETGVEEFLKLKTSGKLGKSE